MNATPPPLPTDMLCFAVYSAAHAVNRAYRPLLAPHGLTYPQYLVLLLLWAEDGRTVSEIGAPLLLDSGTLTPLLGRLERSGLVRRERDGRDERQVRIRLTAAGRALQARLAHVPSAIGCAAGLHPDDLGAMTRRIQELGASLRGSAAVSGDEDAPADA
ncbi:MAG: ohrR [Enterovirga sp.]|nr:ohrR [Enterovirga sp.]